MCFLSIPGKEIMVNDRTLLSVSRTYQGFDLRKCIVIVKTLLCKHTLLQTVIWITNREVFVSLSNFSMRHRPPFWTGLAYTPVNETNVVLLPGHLKRRHHSLGAYS